MKNLFSFDFSHFRGDLFGGLTAGIVALPLALAFGVSSGLGPSAGLYGAIGFDTLTQYIFTAITLALLGAIDSLLTSVVADNMTKTEHEPNKELLGQGIGNSFGALFGGLPGAGATIRTVVNINSGGKTRLSGMIAGLLLLFILLAVGPIA